MALCHHYIFWNSKYMLPLLQTVKFKVTFLSAASVITHDDHCFILTTHQQSASLRHHYILRSTIVTTEPLVFMQYCHSLQTTNLLTLSSDVPLTNNFLAHCDIILLKPVRYVPKAAFTRCIYTATDLLDRGSNHLAVGGQLYTVRNAAQV